MKKILNNTDWRFTKLVISHVYKKQIIRLLEQRDFSRNSGDLLGKAVFSYLKGESSKEELKNSLKNYCERENWFALDSSRKDGKWFDVTI